MITFNSIPPHDGDSGASCNSCHKVAEFRIQANSLSMRLCSACALSLSIQLNPLPRALMETIELDKAIRNYQSRWRVLKNHLGEKPE